MTCLRDLKYTFDGYCLNASNEDISTFIKVYHNNDEFQVTYFQQKPDVSGLSPGDTVSLTEIVSDLETKQMFRCIWDAETELFKASVLGILKASQEEPKVKEEAVKETDEMAELLPLLKDALHALSSEDEQKAISYLKQVQEVMYELQDEELGCDILEACDDLVKGDFYVEEKTPVILRKVEDELTLRFGDDLVKNKLAFAAHDGMLVIQTKHGNSYTVFRYLLEDFSVSEFEFELREALK